MTKKRKRGRPIGGKSPVVMREYWREKQREKRERDLVRYVQKEFGFKSPKKQLGWTPPKKRKRGK